MMNLSKVLLVSVSCMTVLSYSDNLNASPFYKFNRGADEFTFIYTGVSSYASFHTHLSAVPRPQLKATQTISAQRNVLTSDRWAQIDKNNHKQLAAVCFISDTQNCRGNEFVNNPDSSSSGSSSSSGASSSSSGCDPDDIYCNPFPPEETCQEFGFTLTACGDGESPAEYCPLSKKYFRKCECTEKCPQGYQENPCGSGMLQTEQKKLNCKTCYRCTACQDECPSGYTTEDGDCRADSTHQTECGNACYQILDNTCKSGQLSAPAESGGYRNKIVSYTECGNPCFQSYSDNCPSGYVKTKQSGKCYETTIKYTDYGSACYKEKPCCDDTCSGYRTKPTTSQCKWGYTTGKTGCGNTCYTCIPCNNCSGYNVSSSSSCQYGADSCYNQCLGKNMYKCKPCDNGGLTSPASCGGHAVEYTNQCGNKRYACCSCPRAPFGGTGQFERPICSPGVVGEVSSSCYGVSCYYCDYAKRKISKCKPLDGGCKSRFGSGGVITRYVAACQCSKEGYDVRYGPDSGRVSCRYSDTQIYEISDQPYFLSKEECKAFQNAYDCSKSEGRDDGWCIY